MTFEELIRHYVTLKAPNAKGWEPALCKICHDHGNKGWRGGFIFKDKDWSYHCFNCGHKASYEASTATLSDRAKEVLTSFGIPETEWKRIIFQDRRSRGDEQPDDEPIKETRPPKPLTFPSYMVPVQDIDDPIHQAALAHIADRKLDWTAHNYHVGIKTDNIVGSKWYGRLILPTYYGSDLVFYQGRDLTDTRQAKYISSLTSSSGIIEGIDRLDTTPNKPLYITEGWFDAQHVDGIAVFGSTMTKEQVAIINRSSRKKVVIPDRLGDGHLLAEQAIGLGWSVAIPDGGDCKDVTDIVKTYGKMYLNVTLQENTVAGFAAKTRVALYCTQRSRKI